MVRLHSLLSRSSQGALQGIEKAAGRMKQAVTTRRNPGSTSNDCCDDELQELKRENQLLRERVLRLEAALRQHQHATNNNNKFSILRPEHVTVGKKLGQGAFGAVYRGQWRGVPCALKFIDQAVAEELLQEVKIMDQMDHPNICRMYGVVMGDNEHEIPESWPEGVRPPCLVMEYLGYEYDKHSYSTFVDYLRATTALRGDQEHWIQICGMLQGAARGMAYLHSHGVMHRDIKGLNLLLDSRGNLKIADFGLARLSTNENLQKISGGPIQPMNAKGLTVAKGTYTHMAPEVMESGDYDMAADVFSFGIVISEAVAASEAESIVDDTRTREFGIDADKLKTFAKGKISEQLVCLATQCCELDPKKRPTAPQIVAALQVILLEYQTGRLHQVHKKVTVMDSIKAEVTAIEDQASERIFTMADKDGDGYLCFEELQWLDLATASGDDKADLTPQDYSTVCHAVGAESSRGLSSEQVRKLYTELRAGDAMEDLYTLNSLRRNTSKVGT